MLENYKTKLRWIFDQHRRVNQLYDGLPYHVHLNDVFRYGKKYKHLILDEDWNDVNIALWGHDLQEDTGLTYNDIRNILGKKVADIIYAVSNEKGHNRDERANDKYYQGILEDDLAIFVKLCDRLANMTYSKIHGNIKMYKNYQKELEHFKNKLYNGKYQEMWDELNNIHFVEKDNDYFPRIEHFDENNIYRIHLPKPIPGNLFKELYRKGIIPKRELKKNHYYLGKCRNAKVALWNGFEFVYMRQTWKNGTWFPEEINHFEDDNGFDLFVPLKETEPTEEQRIKY